MNLNVSTGVGFATLFGIAIMDGVLMFKGITKYRLQGATRGRSDHSRPHRPAAADLDDVARGHSRPAARFAGDGPGLRRAASAGDGHHLGLDRLDAVHALRDAGVLPHLRAAAARGERRNSRRSQPSRCPTCRPAKLSASWSICTSTRTRRTLSKSRTTRTANSLASVLIVKAAEMLGFVSTPAAYGCA